MLNGWIWIWICSKCNITLSNSPTLSLILLGQPGECKDKLKVFLVAHKQVHQLSALTLTFDFLGYKLLIYFFDQVEHCRRDGTKDTALG